MAKTNKPQSDPNHQDPKANSAYSGSGSMQPGGGTGEPGKLSDFPGGNLDDLKTGPGREEHPANPEGRTMGEATDPSKLSDI